jgi:hypothetical protein
MPAKFLIIGIINLIVWMALLGYAHFYQSSSFLSGAAISFTVSSFIGVFGRLQTILVTLFLGWGLYFFGLSEGYDSNFLLGCAFALTFGVISSFIIARTSE